jgi:enterochelin esterase family protein
MQRSTQFVLLTLAAVSFLPLTAVSQPAETTPRPRVAQGPQVKSPEVSADRRVTFRILAPHAQTVRLSGGDIPGNGQGTALTQGTNGVWEVTLGPIQPGSYRYHLQVNDVPVVDPRNPVISESYANVWSLVHVPGAEYMDTKDVPHGNVAQVTYHSRALGKFRRMHVYTPPGYESGKGRFPVFYLLHGSSDSDNSWSSIGRAGFILDNLIASKQARPMVVVMPAGHTGESNFGPRTPGTPRPGSEEFARDFMEDIMPYVEKHYRVHKNRKNRAIAGLSMGGGHTLRVGIPHLDKFGYLGVFSSGVFGITGRGSTNAPAGPTFEERFRDSLDKPELKKGLKLIWFATGKDDFLLQTSRATVEMLRNHKFDVVYKETEGAHTWIVWREYLEEFAPQLFR